MAVDLESALLRAFVTCARAGSINRAAASLRRTQPALSQQLRRLERVVGEPLLHRTPTGVSLTNAGEILLPYAERVLALSAQALDDTRRALAGQCGVGLIDDLAAARLPQALSDFASFHPEATLEVISTTGPAMRDAWAAGRLDIALCDASYLPEPPRWTARLPLAWVAAPGFDVSTDPLPLVLFSQPCRWRAPVLAALEASGRRWRIAFESTSVAGVQAGVRAGIGVAAVLSANVEPGTSGVVGLPSLPDAEIGLVRRTGTEGNHLINAIEIVLRRMT